MLWIKRCSSGSEWSGRSFLLSVARDSKREVDVQTSKFCKANVYKLVFRLPRSSIMQR
jgi:hypothetical protein